MGLQLFNLLLRLRIMGRVDTFEVVHKAGIPVQGIRVSFLLQELNLWVTLSTPTVSE
jgi:hypothetical protein